MRALAIAAATAGPPAPYLPRMIIGRTNRNIDATLHINHHESAAPRAGAERVKTRSTCGDDTRRGQSVRSAVGDRIGETSMRLDKSFSNVYLHDMNKPVDISSLDLARDAAQNCLCYQVRKLSRRITSAYDSALGETGLKITQFTMLAAVVGSGEGLSLTEIADRLGMDRSTFSRNLTPLVKRGLVEYADTLKGRRRNVRATESGRMLFKAAAPAWQRAQERLHRQLNEAGRAEFLADLRVVADVVKR